MASGAQLGAEFKSVAADVAGYLDSLIDKANGFINSLNAVMELRRAAVRRFDAYADAIDIEAKDAAGPSSDKMRTPSIPSSIMSVTAPGGSGMGHE